MGWGRGRGGEKLGGDAERLCSRGARRSHPRASGRRGMGVDAKIDAEAAAEKQHGEGTRVGQEQASSKVGWLLQQRSSGGLGGACGHVQ